MPNRRLTLNEIAVLNELQDRTVADLGRLAAGDSELLFALRRRLFTRLMHLERGTPAHRRKLKAKKWEAQNGLCSICDGHLEQKGSELDRKKASLGYSVENTRLVHHDCHVADQAAKGFTDREAEIVEHIEALESIEVARDEAEIKIEDKWDSIDISEALYLDGGVPMRCPACHGKLRAHKASNNGMRAHFEHLIAHGGCPLKSTYSGIFSLHPDPLE